MWIRKSILHPVAAGIFLGGAANNHPSPLSDTHAPLFASLPALAPLRQVADSVVQPLSSSPPPLSEVSYSLLSHILHYQSVTVMRKFHIIRCDNRCKVNLLSYCSPACTHNGSHFVHSNRRLMVIPGERGRKGWRT